MSSKYPPSWPPIPDTLLIKISTWNVQGIFLRVKQDHIWHQRSPCPQHLWSGILIVLQIPPFFTPLPDTLIINISTHNFQGIFLRVKQDHMWHQRWPCPPSLWSGTHMSFMYPPSWAPIPDTLLIKISTQKNDGIFLRVKQDHIRYQIWPFPTSLWSPVLDPSFLTHFQ